VEFRYPSRMKKWFVLPLLVLVVITLFYLFNILPAAVRDELTLYQIISNILFPIAPTIITIVVYSLYSSKVSKDVIVLNEKEITQRRNGEITTISWADVIKVEWGSKKSTDGLSIITITANDKVIGIGGHIEGLDQIIQSIKTQVGDRFNTWDIPWKLKNPEAKNW
jgi:hypothetical protein